MSYDANGNIRSYDRNGTTTVYGTPAAGHALEMDRLSYGYTEVSLNGRQVLTSNQLRHVKDAISDAGRYTEDIDNQADDNYSYDAIGNLVRDQQGGNEEIRWTVYGKIAGIHKTDGTQVYYSYDAAGNRISKTVDRSGSTNPSAGVTTTWYVRDAQGNVLSTYEKRGSSPLEQTELHLYGSSRLGIQRTGGLVVEGSLVPLYTYSTETLVRGRKLYELSNHLGNVLATITDKKVLVADGGSAGGTGGICANGGLVEVLDLYNRDGSLSSYRARQEINFYSDFESGSGDEWEGYIDAGATLCDNNGGGGTGSGMPAGSYYVADLVSATDYAPFGMGLVGRTYNAGAYKYGFNGKERDQDIGEDSYDYGLRISDSRLGRFLSVDPLTQKYPELTPYQFASNTPIWAIDLDGAESQTTTTPVVPEVVPEQVAVPTSTMQSQGGASNLRVGPGGIIQRSNTPSLPASSAQLDAPSRFLSTGEINRLIPPYCQGFNISRDGNSATVTGANGSSWQVSLLKPQPVKIDPKYAGAFVNQAFQNNIQLANPAAKISESSVDFKKDQPGLEYFYRAMSLTEFRKTGGFIQSRGDGRDDYPFITSNLDYLLNKKSLLWTTKGTRDYDMIVRYSVQTGTHDYLNSVSVPHGTAITQQAILSNSPVKKSEAYTTFGGVRMLNANFGFPGQSGTIHFNPKIVEMTVIPTSATGLKNK